MKITDTQPPTIFCNFSNDFFYKYFYKISFRRFLKIKDLKNYFHLIWQIWIYITKKLIAKKLSGEF